MQRRDDVGKWLQRLDRGDQRADLVLCISEPAPVHHLRDRAMADLAVGCVTPIAQGIDHHRSHGIGVADFDRDGDLDVVVGHSLARCSPTSYPDSVDPCYATGQIRYWRNVIGGNFIQLHLVGSIANGHAIGARVSVTTTGVATPITQRHDIEGGHGHFTAEDDMVQHFGLGTAREADVTIRWPEASLPTQTFHVVAGHRYLVHEGQMPVLDDVAPTTSP